MLRKYCCHDFFFYIIVSLEKFDVRDEIRFTSLKWSVSRDFQPFQLSNNSSWSLNEYLNNLKRFREIF